jgi:hypothetical protein
MDTYLKAVPVDAGNIISHHGIKGMKWGIRRFQNPDGTRTPLGRKRERENAQVDHSTLIKSTNAKELYKNRDQLSDKELQERLNRLRNEEALRQMADPKAKVNNGQSFSKKVLSKIGEKSAEILAVAAIGTLIGTVDGKDIATAIRNGAKSVVEYGPDAVDFLFDPWKP